jgi:hypothetical protein
LSRIVLPNQLLPGASIKGMVLACRSCSKAVPPEEWKEGQCIECKATVLCEPLRAELVRLYHKRTRLIQRFGDPLEVKKGQFNPASRFVHLDEQAERVRRRIVLAVQKLTGNPKRVEEIVNQQGQQAREAAMTKSRIHLVPFGMRA